MKTTQVRMMCCLIRIYTRAFMDAPLCARNMIICLGKLHVQRRCVTYMEYRPTYNTTSLHIELLVLHISKCTSHCVHNTIALVRCSYYFRLFRPFFVALPWTQTIPTLCVQFHLLFCVFSLLSRIFMSYCILHSITHMEYNYTFPGF